ncbi:MAG: radical SAM protein [Telmatospirillum sp.]|nr:radical SAM protein [Telmatospirillum sp.]
MAGDFHRNSIFRGLLLVHAVTGTGRPVVPRLTPVRKENSMSSLPKLPLPTPSMGVAAYDEERRLRLAGDSRCRENFELYKRSQRDPDIRYLPIKLDIENVSRCNFRCTMCQVSEWPKGKRAEDMSLADFKALIDEQYGLVEIKLQGMGEPTLGAPAVFDMIRYARERHIWVRTVTNASLLHLKDNYRHMVDCDPNEIQISIDGATKEVFESIRKGSVFEMVVENTARLNAYCREQNVTRTKMWTVVQHNNAHQLPDLVELAARLGFTSMVFSLDIGDWGNNVDWHDRNKQISVDDVSMASAEKLIARGHELGVTVAFWNIAAKYGAKAKSELCPWPFERAYVASDLRVVPCCMIANPDTYELGMAKPFKDVWFGQTMQDFRHAHIEGRPPKVCEGCYDLE